MSRATRKNQISSATHTAIQIAGLTLNASWDGPEYDLIAPRTNTLAEMRSILAILSYVGVDTSADIHCWPEGEILDDTNMQAEWYDCLISVPDYVTRHRSHYARVNMPDPDNRTVLPFSARIEGDTLILESATHSYALTRSTPNLKAAVARIVKKLLQ